MDLSTGTVTFLFTDIEGSTRLWEEFPEQMRAALARHDAILHEAIRVHQGKCFKTVGDAFYAVFTRAPDAALAALAIQQALLAEPWPPEVPIRVRAALHAGTAERRDGDYFGQALNRIARVLAIGHGGQTLLSRSAADLVREALPKDASLIPRGEHQLKDLAHPETVFELRHPDLPSEFPPLRSLQSRTTPHNLPHQLSSFIGREQEIQEVEAGLRASRLLTLVGAGGCGKTRLALQAAANLLESYPDGVWLVELAPLVEPSLVLQRIAQVLGAREESGKPILQTLQELLQSKRVLLLLDNCEHLIQTCAGLTDALLRTCAQLTVLATSREALNVAGERTLYVPSLSLPDPGQVQSADHLGRYEAVQLFVERARAVRPDFAVTDQNASSLARVCYRLDGIPLALELAAARIRSLSVEEIHNRLDQRFRLLTGGSRSALPRQQTLGALIDWSYNLLNELERKLLRRLSVLAGRWSLAAAEQVGADTPGAEGASPPIEEWEVLDLLTGLVDKSLVTYQERYGDTCYRMLETIRQYASEKLAASDDAELTRNRHCLYFLQQAEEAEPQLVGPDQAAWLTRLEAQHDNLRAALQWCVQPKDDPDWTTPSSLPPDTGLRLVGSLCRFWNMRSHLSEGRAWCNAVLETSPPDDAEGLPKLLNGAGGLAHHQGDSEQATHSYERLLALQERRGDRRGIAYALDHLGFVAFAQGDHTASRARHERSLEILRELQDRHGIAIALCGMGNVDQVNNDYERARACYEESLEISRELGDFRNVAVLLNNLAVIAQECGEYAEARSYHEQSLVIKREQEDRLGIAFSLGNLGSVALKQGDLAAARACYEQSLALQREIGDRQGPSFSLHGLGEVARIEGDRAQARLHYRDCLRVCIEVGARRAVTFGLEGLAALSAECGVAGYHNGAPEVRDTALQELHRAARLWGAAQALRTQLGAALSPMEQAEQDAQTVSPREILGETAWKESWMEGGALSMEQAVQLGMDEEKDT